MKLGRFSFVWLAALCCCSAAADQEKHYRGKHFHDSKYHGGAQKIPGRVQCAYYDLGGDGVACHDTDAKNNGSGSLNPADGTYLNQFRMDEGVDTSYAKFHRDIETDDSPYNLVPPPENQLYVGWTEPGEWPSSAWEVRQRWSARIMMKWLCRLSNGRWTLA